MVAAQEPAPERSFSQGLGDWSGTAEVFDGEGKFLGNAADRRHVQKQQTEDSIRIDLSFVGPFKFAGHYTISDKGTHRLYEGPANIGYAETLSSGLVDANGYWPIVGLSQRFFLYVLPGGERQLSLALMSRGEQLIYTVVGEYQRMESAAALIPPGFVNGSAFDFADDPNAGRPQALLLRSGRWTGRLTELNENLVVVGESEYSESVRPTGEQLRLEWRNSRFGAEEHEVLIYQKKALVWTGVGEVVGSANLSGGRALSGQFHHRKAALRVWRREVASHDGTHKVVLLSWYRGGQRIGVQHGVLNFEAADD